MSVRGRAKPAEVHPAFTDQEPATGYGKPNLPVYPLRAGSESPETRFRKESTYELVPHREETGAPNGGPTGLVDVRRPGGPRRHRRGERRWRGRGRMLPDGAEGW